MDDSHRVARKGRETALTVCSVTWTLCFLGALVLENLRFIRMYAPSRCTLSILVNCNESQLCRSWTS